MKNSNRTYYLLGRTAIMLFVVSFSLILLDHYTRLSINNTVLYFILFYITVATCPVVIAVFVLNFKTANAILTVLFAALAICAVIAFLSWENDWKTQTIVYRHVKNPAATIEYRIRKERFVLGYQKQMVRKEKILPFMDLITDADTSQINADQWRRVDERINEMKIPGEYEDL